jgi:Zn-dependent peptidase ImmA (M78 family)
MKAPARESIPVIKAREIIAKLEIEDPSEIEIELIAANEGAPVLERPLQGSDGRMVRLDGSALITVRESIRFLGQKRFVVGHELGHVLLHPHVRQIDEVSVAQASNYSHNQEPEEIEANLFAAEILMPAPLFAPRILNKEPSFALLKELAEEFRTTLTATAIQFLRYTKEECALISSKGGRRRWAWPSERLSFQLREEQDIHDYTCASELAKSGESHARGDDVPAGCWLHGFSPDGKECVTEDSIHSKDFGETLSLIWIHEAI